MTRTDWYALHVVGDYGKHLRRAGLDPFVPTEERITYARRHHATIRRRTERPLFPGLAFVHMATPRWHKVLAIPCVTGVFMPYGEPYRFLSDDMVTLGALGNRPALLPYSRGDAVRFVTGPLVDYDFSVKSVDFRENEVRLLREIMGRVVEIEARAGDVRRCA
jgi:transcription antitermination factor NusG